MSEIFMAHSLDLYNDVIRYCKSKGSNVRVCSLDAESAFGGIPHSILVHKPADIIPDQLWRRLYDRYSDLSVYSRRNNGLSECIPIA